MLFRRNIEPRCAYCNYGMSMGFGEIACSKRGIMEDNGNCGLFRYEPTKRKPEYARNKAAKKIKNTDFSI